MSAFETTVKKLTGVTGNTTTFIPAGYSIVQIHFVNNTTNAVTGGIRIGTTGGGTDVAVAIAVGASSIVSALDSAVLKKLFSTSAAQTLFLEAVVAWNSANLDIYFVIQQLTP